MVWRFLLFRDFWILATNAGLYVLSDSSTLAKESVLAYSRNFFAASLLASILKIVAIRFILLQSNERLSK